MTATSEVRAQVDERIKDEATAVLAAMGLTPSDALQMMMTRIAADKALPFDGFVPNETTIEAMHEARRGELPRFDSVDALMADLRADD